MKKSKEREKTFKIDTCRGKLPAILSAMSNAWMASKIALGLDGEQKLFSLYVDMFQVRKQWF